METQFGICVYCDESICVAEDGAWQGCEDGACGCTASLEQGGDGEHEAARETIITADRECGKAGV